VAETTALGAAYLAGLATGYWSDRAEIDANWRLSRRYVPSFNEDQRAHVYGRWLEAVKRAKDWAREEGQ
jgi:glycerol kinase